MQIHSFTFHTTFIVLTLNTSIVFTLNTFIVFTLNKSIMFTLNEVYFQRAAAVVCGVMRPTYVPSVTTGTIWMMLHRNVCKVSTVESHYHCTQLMRDGVTLQRRLSLAGCNHSATIVLSDTSGWNQNGRDFPDSIFKCVSRIKINNKHSH